MADSIKEKQDVLSFRPDLEFDRRPITGDGDVLSEDPSSSESVRQKISASQTEARRRRLKRLKAIDDKLDKLEKRITDNLKDFSISFDPTERPALARAVDTLMRDNGAVPTSESILAASAMQSALPDDDTIIRTMDEQPDTPPGDVDLSDIPAPPESKITLECYQRATTLLMDSMYHAYGIDPVSFGLANTGEGVPKLVPPPSGKPKNCAEMASMSGVDMSENAELKSADAIMEQKQQNTLLDLVRILWKLLLYFIYGFIIEFMKRLRLHKIPFGVGKKVKKLIRKLEKKRRDIMCTITGDCSDGSDDGEDYVPNPNDGFENMDTIGDDTWSGMECLSAAKTVADFVATQLAFQPATDISAPVSPTSSLDSSSIDGDNKPKSAIKGKAHLLPVLNAVTQARDRVEAVKFATILEIPSSETELENDIEQLESTTKSRPRYGNRFHTRTGQGWKNLR